MNTSTLYVILLLFLNENQVLNGIIFIIKTGISKNYLLMALKKTLIH